MSGLLFNIYPLFSQRGVTVLGQEYLGVAFLQFRDHFLSVFQLDQGWLQGLDCKQDFSPKTLTAHYPDCSLEDIVAELVVNQLLDDETHSFFQVFGLLCFVSELLYYLEVVIGESSLEDLIDVRFVRRGIVCAAHFGIKTFLDNIGGKFKLAKSDEIFGNLLEYLFVLLPVLELYHVLNQVISVRVFDQLMDVLDDVVGEVQLLAARPFLKAPLHDATTMLVLPD